MSCRPAQHCFLLPRFRASQSVVEPSPGPHRMPGVGIPCRAGWLTPPDPLGLSSDGISCSLLQDRPGRRSWDDSIGPALPHLEADGSGAGPGGDAHPASAECATGGMLAAIPIVVLMSFHDNFGQTA